MSHLGFVLGAYVIGVMVPFTLALAAWRRTMCATRRLLAIDPRVQRRGSEAKPA